MKFRSYRKHRAASRSIRNKARRHPGRPITRARLVKRLNQLSAERAGCERDELRRLAVIRAIEAMIEEED